MSAPSSLAGQSGGLTCLASEAECGQGQQGEEHAGPHGASEVALGLLLRVRCSHQPPAPFILSGPCPGGQGGPQGTLPGPFGVIRPRSIGQTPKDVVVGTRAAWAGPWEWRRRVGGNLRLPASGCPSSLPKGATQVHQSLLSLGDPTSQLNRPGGVWGGPEVQNRSEQNWAAALADCDFHCQPWAGAKPQGGSAR